MGPPKGAEVRVCLQCQGPDRVDTIGRVLDLGDQGEVPVALHLRGSQPRVGARAAAPTLHASFFFLKQAEVAQRFVVNAPRGVNYSSVGMQCQIKYQKFIFAHIKQRHQSVCAITQTLRKIQCFPFPHPKEHICAQKKQIIFGLIPY